MTGNGYFRKITADVLDYVMREMSGPVGGFYSTQDADSEGNGLMLAALADVARALQRDDGPRALTASYRLVAERNAEFLLQELRQESCRLLQTWEPRPGHYAPVGSA